MTEYQYGKVAEALGPKLRACPVCGAEHSWLLLDGYHLLPIHSTPQTTVGADSVIPTVMVSCMNCGLIQTHNTHVLGVSEVLGIPKPGEAF